MKIESRGSFSVGGIASKKEDKQWIYVFSVFSAYSGSDWGSFEALYCLCFFSVVESSLCSSEQFFCESICFNAIEAKKDLLPSCVFWRI